MTESTLLSDHFKLKHLHGCFSSKLYWHFRPTLCHNPTTHGHNLTGAKSRLWMQEKGEVNSVTPLRGRLYRNLIALPFLLSCRECSELAAASTLVYSPFMDFFFSSLSFFSPNGIVPPAELWWSRQGSRIRERVCEWRCVSVCRRQTGSVFACVWMKEGVVDFHSRPMSSLYTQKQESTQRYRTAKRKDWGLGLLCPDGTSWSFVLRIDPVRLKCGQKGFYNQWSAFCPVWEAKVGQET